MSTALSLSVSLHLDVLHLRLLARIGGDAAAAAAPKELESHYYSSSQRSLGFLGSIEVDALGLVNYPVPFFYLKEVLAFRGHFSHTHFGYYSDLRKDQE
ncbi:hypothetical protein TorRG33x02_298590 [Trema orientale]|uniref:Uncharacterized protein n=1 Tax=Trema orientale TaxID=63057 RepID=A0A2P5C3R5_TREOI|nr:hypothetical protein TorRG33x02_298590 [Trema orientale]